MADPSSSSDLMGFSPSSLLAGISGALASLSFIPGLSRWQALITVLTGMVASAYLAPVAAAALSQYFHVSPTVERGLGFVIGLCAMSLLGGILKTVKRIADDPIGFWRGSKGGR